LGQIIDVSGVKVHYEDVGSGPTVVMVHGFGQSSYVWREMLDRLPQWRIIAPDLKGLGRSDKPDDGRYGLFDQAGFVSAFIDAMQLSSFALVGHSFGGAIAIQLALRLNDGLRKRVRGLALMDSAAFPQRLPWWLKLFCTPILGELAVGIAPPRLGAYLALKLSYANKSAATWQVASAYAAATRMPGGRRALLATARQMVPPDIDGLVDEYGRIDIPALIIWGRNDPTVPLHVGESLQDALPQARLEVIDRCGHCPQEERPEQTASLLRGFLSKL